MRRSFIFILISIFYLSSVQIVSAFVYDDFSEDNLDTTRWDLFCLGDCPSETRIANTTFRLLGKSDGSYIYLKGFRFSSGDVLGFDFVYVNGTIGFQYGDYPPYPSFFPDNNRLQSTGRYSMEVKFLENKKVEWSVNGVNGFNQSGRFSYATDTPIFYPSVGHGEMYLDNFTITSNKRIPYKIEIVELPISTYSGNDPSIYKNIIAYRSGYGEISVYNIETKENNIIASSIFELSKPKSYEKGVVYLIGYRERYNEIRKYDFESNKTYILVPGLGENNFVVDENKIIVSIDCQNYPNYTDCHERILKSNYEFGSARAFIDLSLNKDYPEAYVLNRNCSFNLERNQISKNKSITRDFSKKYNSPYNCQICDVITGEKIFLVQSCTKIKNNQVLLVGNTIYDIMTQNTYELTSSCDSLPYNENLCEWYNLGFGCDRYDDKKVCFSGNKTYLSYVKYGNLAEICNNYSKNTAIGNVNISNTCSIVNQTKCSCRFLGVEAAGQSSSVQNYSFELINLDGQQIGKTLDDIRSNILADIQNKIEQRIKEDEEREMKIEQEKQTQETILYLIVTVISIMILGILWKYYNWRNQRHVLINNATESLNSTKELLTKEKPLKEILNSENRHIKLYKEAVNAFNNKKYEECIKLAEKSLKMKNEEIEKHNKKLEETKLKRAEEKHK